VYMSVQVTLAVISFARFRYERAGAPQPTNREICLSAVR